MKTETSGPNGKNTKYRKMPTHAHGYHPDACFAVRFLFLALSSNHLLFTSRPSELGKKQRHELADLNDAILSLNFPLPLSSLPTVCARRPLAKRRDPLSYLRTRCLHDSRELRAVTRLALRLAVAATSIIKRHPLRDGELRPQRTGMGCRVRTRAGVCQMRRVVRAAHEQQRVDGVHFRLLAGHAQDTHRPLRLAGSGRRWCTDIGEGVGDLDFCLGPEHGRRRAPRC